MTKATFLSPLTIQSVDELGVLLTQHRPGHGTQNVILQRHHLAAILEAFGVQDIDAVIAQRNMAQDRLHVLAEAVGGLTTPPHPLFQAAVRMGLIPEPDAETLTIFNDDDPF